MVEEKSPTHIYLVVPLQRHPGVQSKLLWNEGEAAWKAVGLPLVAGDLNRLVDHSGAEPLPAGLLET